MADTLADLFKPHRHDRPAIGAPGRPWLDYGALEQLAKATRQSLNVLGVGRGDRVAIVLPNGPEMATCFVTVATGAVTAPLNPAYREEEFDFYLADLNAKALIVAEDDESPAVTVARRRGIQVVRLAVKEGAAAGDFALRPEEVAAEAPAAGTGLAAPDDVGLVLHTSGTTSRPKIVPLSQKNLAASAGHIARTLELGVADRCLNIMPLFHIHGLLAAVLATLQSGGSVFCTPGFNALRFFAWLEEANPTWYTAVPTMHQAILARAERNKAACEAAGLRFIRSSSSSLPPQVMEALEATFHCPVIESYGMTEAAHQMASNLLPPGARKPGSVGVAAGPEIRICAEDDARFVPRGEAGEVCISGPNVTPAYEANPDANAKSFFELDGKRWFRTGDQGVLDDEGYLRITGRLKEIINRGGEKVSPLEVDECLMDHPAVQQVVTFAMPHDKLGEEVAAAVVLREGQEASERELRDFAAAHLADFKVPRKVLIVAEIPKGATGKMQRIGLADKLGVA
jgi:acyl-CoA synthetase (AMP-forming)/AMP-acid ligase II